MFVQQTIIDIFEANSNQLKPVKGNLSTSFIIKSSV